MKGRIYIKPAKPGLPARLVRALNNAQALAHVAKGVIDVRVASQDELLAARDLGVEIENAIVETPVQGQLPGTTANPDPSLAVVGQGQASSGPDETAVVYDFEKFKQHGRDHGANIVDGLPWSWSFYGLPVTHENADCYIVGDVRFESQDTISVSGGKPLIHKHVIAETRVPKKGGKA